MDGDSHRERRIGFSYLVLAIGIGLVFLNWVLQNVVSCGGGDFGQWLLVVDVVVLWLGLE